MSESEPKAVIFDVVGTIALRDRDLGRDVPRSPSLATTLQALNAAGIELFLVSTVAGRIVRDNTFPGVKFETEIPLDDPDDDYAGKRDAFALVIDRLIAKGIPKEQIVAIGDNPKDEGKAAQANGIRFVQVHSFYPGLPDTIPDLERKLKTLFPSVLVRTSVNDTTGLMSAANVKRRLEPSPAPVGGRKLVR
jgi:hypothetical protein